MAKIKQRPIDQKTLDQLLEAKIPELLARIIAARPLPQKHPRGVESILDPQLSDLDNPFSMRDMQQAAERLIIAIQQKQTIGLETDHDCDGQTSHAILYQGLSLILGHDKQLIRSYIGHRMQEGYGLSEGVAERILKDKPDLVITADNGSADEPRIAKLKQAGIETIVTDHHHLPEDGPPKSAYACLNPTREDCNFPDPYIAGCMVAWLLIAATRRLMIEQGLLDRSAPSMTTLLDFVAVGTVADCVSMARSVNNRCVVHYGLKKINQNLRPCWQAIRRLKKTSQINAEDLGFTIGPLLNSDGRLSDAFGSVNFLLAKDLAEAEPWAQQLSAQNQERKKIQRQITNQAMEIAEQQVNNGHLSIVVFLDDGHAGVHGISASRIKDHFGRPTIIFSPKQGEEKLISGSARSIDQFHMRDALQAVANQHPKLLQKFGGHKGAAGLTINKKDFEPFSQAFEQVTQTLLKSEDVGPIIHTDGELSTEQFTLDTLELLQQLEPFGREFEAPIFQGEATVLRFRRVGEYKTHAQLSLEVDDNFAVNAIWFNCCQKETDWLDTSPGDQVSFTYSLNDNTFRDQRTLQLQIHSLSQEQK